MKKWISALLESICSIDPAVQFWLKELHLEVQPASTSWNAQAYGKLLKYFLFRASWLKYQKYKFLQEAAWWFNHGFFTLNEELFQNSNYANIELQR